MMNHPWQECSVFPGCCSQCEPGSIMRPEDAEDGVWSKKPARVRGVMATVQPLPVPKPKAGAYR